ncbi:DUF1330 domain-containing protein [Candidatus Halocynthiibacter alkanivorans]|uniref:DUF1330 domain-containing protein n=1 Tax=Candidatus Halocynthiibacter alkanivorans TaxID=2267619 RepID=UPI000DF36394|nr:DUF1330 domain-containing protein [Candidatus Halocynthiibacter alkanivorans]
MKSAQQACPPRLPYRLEVHLWVKPGKIAEFQAFEAQAFEIMQQHGAQPPQVRNPTPSGPDTPSEIHLLEFPSEAAFDAYRDDPRLHALAALRDSCIARTRIMLSDQS